MLGVDLCPGQSERVGEREGAVGEPKVEFEAQREPAGAQWSRNKDLRQSDFAWQDDVYWRSLVA